MSADEMLARSWRDLYPDANPAAVASQWRDYARKWHPDRCADPRAADVMSHVTVAKERALSGPKLRRASFAMAKTGKLMEFSYLSRRAWEAGEIFVTPTKVVYRVDPAYADLAFQADRRKWHFVNARFETEMSRFLPRRSSSLELRTEGKLMIYERAPDQVLLPDLLERLSGPVDHRHVMWMISRLLNICSYLFMEDLTHYGLLPEMLLVNPAQHYVALTGPCLYMEKGDARPSAVPSEVLARWPGLRDKSRKPPQHVADTTQVRQLALRMLGVNDLASLRLFDKHDGLREWLMSKPDWHSIQDFKNWERLRGERHFTPMDLTPEQVYDLG